MAGVVYGWQRHGALQRYEDGRVELRKRRNAERLAATKNAIASGLAGLEDAGDGLKETSVDRLPADDGPKDQPVAAGPRDDSRHGQHDAGRPAEEGNVGGQEHRTDGKDNCAPTALQQYEEWRDARRQRQDAKSKRALSSSADPPVVVTAARRYDWTDDDSPFVFST